MKYLTIIPLITVVACSTPEPLCDRERQPWDKFGTQEDQCTETAITVSVPDDGSGSDRDTRFDSPNTVQPDTDKPVDKVNPDKLEDKVKGNASANNKKGGNYDKTGHEDNGKGKGRYK